MYLFVGDYLLLTTTHFMWPICTFFYIISYKMERIKGSYLCTDWAIFQKRVRIFLFFVILEFLQYSLLYWNFNDGAGQYPDNRDKAKHQIGTDVNWKWKFILAIIMQVLLTKILKVCTKGSFFCCMSIHPHSCIDDNHIPLYFWDQSLDRIYFSTLVPFSLIWQSNISEYMNK